MKRAMQSAARRYTSQSPGRACPRTSLRIAWLVMPNARPLAIEYVSGMMITVRKAGMAMPGSAQSISASAPIISAPTRISAGAVAAVGMACTRGKEQRGQEEHPDHDARETGTGTHSDTRSALYIARDRTGSHQGAEQHCGGVGQQNPIHSRDRSVGCDQARLLGDGHQCADVVEHVDKQEHEHDLEEREPDAAFPVERLAHVELEGRCREIAETVGAG